MRSQEGLTNIVCGIVFLVGGAASSVITHRTNPKEMPAPVVQYEAVLEKQKNEVTNRYRIEDIQKRAASLGSGNEVLLQDISTLLRHSNAQIDSLAQVAYAIKSAHPDTFSTYATHLDAASDRRIITGLLYCAGMSLFLIGAVQSSNAKERRRRYYG